MTGTRVISDEAKFAFAFAFAFSVAVITYPLRYYGLIKEKEIHALYRPMCWADGHKWAYEDRYGVEPVCLTCGKDQR